MSNNPYDYYKELAQAGWERDFDISPGGFLIVKVAGAPALGSHPGGVLWAGDWMRPDGLSIFQRSNMDRSQTTYVTDPMGNTVHDFKRPSLAAACDHLRTLNLI